MSDILAMVKTSFADISERVETMVNAIEQNRGAAEEQSRATDEIANKMASLGQQIDDAIAGILQEHAA